MADWFTEARTILYYEEGRVATLQREYDRLYPVFSAAMAVSPAQWLEIADLIANRRPGESTAIIMLADSCRRAKEGK